MSRVKLTGPKWNKLVKDFEALKKQQEEVTEAYQRLMDAYFSKEQPKPKKIKQPKQPKLCSVEGCNNKYHAKGMCHPHYYEANKEAINARSRLWNAANKERKKQLIVQWREKNREKYRETSRKSMAKRLQDPNARMAQTVRSRIGTAVRRWVATGSVPPCHYKTSNIDYQAIVDHLGPPPEGKWCLRFVVRLRSFDLSDPKQFELATSPQNVKYECK